MKALYIGSTRGTSCALHYFTSLVKLGVDVLPFDPEFFVARSLIERLIMRARRGPTFDKIAAISEKILSLCRKNHFDFVFVMAENFVGHVTMEKIRRAVKNPPVFLYHSHDNNFSAGICKPPDFDKTLKAYDFAFTTKSQNVERYHALGQSRAYFIPSAYEPTVHQPIPDNDSRMKTLGIQVSFIGTYDRSRDPIFNQLGWEHLQVWGDYWKRSPHYLKQFSRIHPQAVFYFEFADIISHSKISLGLLREEAGDRHTQRTFEIPACGGLQFAPRNDEIASFFKEGEEIVLFGSVDELRDKIQFFLNNDSLRKKIAQSGYERCLRDKHSYVDRVRTMLEIAQLTNVASPDFRNRA